MMRMVRAGVVSSSVREGAAGTLAVEDGDGSGEMIAEGIARRTPTRMLRLCVRRQRTNDLEMLLALKRISMLRDPHSTASCRKRRSRNALRSMNARIRNGKRRNER